LDEFLPLNDAQKRPDAAGTFAFLSEKRDENKNCERFVSMVFVSAPAMPR
jgi:hypothetical protein